MRKKRAFPTSVNDQITDAVTQSNNKFLTEKMVLQEEIINQLKARIASQENIISQLISKIPYGNNWYPAYPYSYPVTYSESGNEIKNPSPSPNPYVTYANTEVKNQ